MKFRFPKLVLLGLIAVVIAACSSQKPPEQVVMVTAANETAARARLHAIAAAEAQYQVASGGEYGTLDQLVNKGYVNDPSSGKLTGYRFEVQVKQGGFQATAVPVQTGISGTRSFYVDETNVMHAADKKGAPATASDPEA
jgi:outer membrane protein TolC